MVVTLAGGTGGAKLAAGLYELLGEELAVVANTGDDVEAYGVHVSPDPDLIAYRLAGALDERGFGIAGDTFGVLAALREAGHETWFQLGDKDLAMCLIRTELLRLGARLTEAHGGVVAALGITARILPMSDDPVRTEVRTDAGWRPFQEFMIVDRAEPPVREVRFRGADTARPTPEVLEAVERADAIVIGPSNPIISIGPVLAVPGLRDALARSRAPVVAVSPYVAGRVVKGPTDAFMSAAGLARGAAGVVAAYGDLLDGIVADEQVTELPALETGTLMQSPADARRLAEQTLAFAATLRSQGF